MDRRALPESIRAHGVAVGREIGEAFGETPMEPFLVPDLRPLAYASAPVPYSGRFRDAILPSPALLATSLGLLDIGPKDDVGIVGACSGYPAALVAALTRGRVSVAEADADLRSHAERALRAMGLSDRVLVAGNLEGAGFHRLLILDPAQRPLSEVLSHLGDGVAVHRATGREPAFRKLVRSRGAETELTVEELPGVAGHGPASLSRLIVREELAQHAWEGRFAGHHDAHFADSVKETFSGGPLDADLHELPTVRLAARRAFHVAYILQSLGELEDAADLYRRSLALFPTAEGHTFLGWVHSFEGDLDGAIEECHRAIETDPSFGNPLNDIGAYLLQRGEPDEAIPWLKRAVEAPRYCCYFFAHTNLGRAYMMKGQSELARKHFEEALRLNHDYAPASEMLRQVDRGRDYVA